MEVEKLLEKITQQARKEVKDNEKIHNLIRDYLGKTFIDSNDVENIIDDYREGARLHYMSTNEDTYLSFEEWLNEILEQQEWRNL